MSESDITMPNFEIEQAHRSLGLLRVLYERFPGGLSRTRWNPEYGWQPVGFEAREGEAAPYEL